MAELAPIHLHVHSTYTLLGATASVAALANQAAADSLTHLALTDSNVLYGAVAFQKACQKVEVEPILGMTLTVRLPDGLVTDGSPDQLVLIACGPAGYRSLCRLSSHIQANPERETLAQQGVPWSLLKEQHAGLVCIAGGRRSRLERWWRSGDQKQAAMYVSHLAGLFDEQLYLALEIHQPADVEVAKEIARLGKRFGLPTVAVQPIYCLAPQERPRLRLLAAIDRNCPLAEIAADSLPDGGDSTLDLHWLSPTLMQERFAHFPDALAATQTIAAGCEPALPDGRPIWPVLKLPEGTTPDVALIAQAEAGLRERYPFTPPQPSPVWGGSSDGANGLMGGGGSDGVNVAMGGGGSDGVNGLLVARLQHELQVINTAGYAPLFLLVADIVRYAREQTIPVSTRGSVANSLVAYCIGITTVDPIIHDLLFERFLHPDRTSPPDIDLDFCSVRRDEVLDYVRQTYGADRVALVATVSTMRPRSAIGETAKAYGVSEEEAKALVKLLPDQWHPDPRRQVRSSLEVLLEAVPEPHLRRVITAAFELIGQPHHLSIHPGGLVVTPGPLTDVVPVQWTPKGFTITQFDHGEVEAIGLPKVDLLGIRALTVLAEATRLVRRHYDSTFRLEDLALDDAHTADLLASGDTVGVFQCESTGARRTLRQLKVRTVQDLAVANAFFKPGPATGGMAGPFIRRYRGEEAVTYLHQALEPILGPTKGVLIFQEQVLRVAQAIAGLSWLEADELRKGMSKFQPEAMTRMAARFIAGCQRPAPAGHGLTAQQAATLWEQVQAFAGYGFNQGHATAYADVSYRSAYLKAHFPAAFLAARLANYGGFYHPAIYLAEAQRLGIRVEPPHVNHSRRHFALAFTADGQQPVLWMGLGQVRHLRRRSAIAIMAQRRKAPFADLIDFSQRVELQSKELTHLIQCGALDGLGESRAAMLAQAKAGGAKRWQMAFTFDEPTVAAESADQRLRWERLILGQPVSVHPLRASESHPTATHTLTQAAAQPGRRVQIAGTRLPGWTGGKGFFVDDGETYAVAIPSQKLATPRSWSVFIITGRWLMDEWGGGWLQVERLETTD